MRTYPLTALAVVLCALCAAPCRAQDFDPLALEAEAPPAATASPLRVGLDLAGGRLSRRGGGSDDTSRASVDLRYTHAFSPAWQFLLSDRVDRVDPPLPGRPNTTNSLRELALGWRSADATTSVDLGRVTVRQGPAYGYNPTDFFRDGALRAVTTADPVALRETRLGTAMIRAGTLWDDGGLSVAFAPRLDDPDPATAAVDLGSTNHRDRFVATLDRRFGERSSVQGLVMLEAGRGATLGASGSTLIGDALVAYGEWSWGKGEKLLPQVLGLDEALERHHRAATGLTYTFPTGLALTVEAEYNGAGLDEDDWRTLAALGTPAYASYLAATQPSQEMGARRAWLLYLSQKSLGTKNLDLTAFVRHNASDGSRLAWLELRYHFSALDLALQWQHSSGDAASEFGANPYRRVLQAVVGTVF